MVGSRDAEDGRRRDRHPVSHPKGSCATLRVTAPEGPCASDAAHTVSNAWSVRFVGQAFSPHRHDSYTIGLTLEGVQTFRYRGARRICLPGECHVLHPDELHDGGSGSAAPFAYRIAYVDAALDEALFGE